MKLILKKTSFLAVAIFMWLITSAQQNHFIYLQTENKQAFYVKLDKKILSSSASGYLIIPKLHDGTHTLTLGFPKNEWPEQKVTCTIDKKDAGFILKNFGEKGWGLFSWQSLNVVMASSKTEEPAAVVKKEEPAKINEQQVTAQEVPIKQEPTETAVKNAETTSAIVKKEEQEKPLLSSVTKLQSNKTSGGIEMTFADAANGMADTIRIFLPVEVNESIQPSVKKEEPKAAEIKDVKPVTADSPSVAVIRQDVKKEPEVFKTDKPANSSVKEITTPQQETVKKTVIQNSDCRAFATEDDFMKLRKKMAAEDSDDDMVSAARKVFKTKCFTVEQIKNLSALFLNDNGRYKFFDAAYPFISDTYNFSSLQKLLTDDYYINRFKAMLRQ